MDDNKRLHDNILLHAALATQQRITDLQWEPFAARCADRTLAHLIIVCIGQCGVATKVNTWEQGPKSASSLSNGPLL